MRLMFHEIVKNIENCSTPEQAKDMLFQYGIPSFREFLVAAYSPTIQFDISPPNYRPAQEPEGLNWALLENEVGKLYRFVTNHPMKPKELTKDKQQQLLLVVLESLHKDEAELLYKTINKQLTIKNINIDIINEVFPGLIK